MIRELKISEYVSITNHFERMNLPTFEKYWNEIQNAESVVLTSVLREILTRDPKPEDFKKLSKSVSGDISPDYNLFYMGFLIGTVTIKYGEPVDNPFYAVYFTPATIPIKLMER